MLAKRWRRRVPLAIRRYIVNLIANGYVSIVGLRDPYAIGNADIVTAWARQQVVAPCCRILGPGMAQITDHVAFDLAAW